MVFLERAVLVSLLTVSLLCLISDVFLNYHYAYNLPHVPVPELEREYPLHVHRTIVYLTKRESLQLEWLYLVMTFTGLGGAVVHVIFRPFGKNGQRPEEGGAR